MDVAVTKGSANMTYTLPIQLPYKVTFRHFRIPSGRPHTFPVWYHRHAPRGHKWGKEGIFPQGNGWIEALNIYEGWIKALNIYEVKPLERGGSTMCLVEVQVSEGKVIKKYFKAECSTQDAFSYKLGREIALGRARKYFGHPQTVDLFELYDEVI